MDNREIDDLYQYWLEMSFPNTARKMTDFESDRALDRPWATPHRQSPHERTPSAPTFDRAPYTLPTDPRMFNRRPYTVPTIPEQERPQELMPPQPQYGFWQWLLRNLIGQQERGNKYQPMLPDAELDDFLRRNMGRKRPNYPIS